MKNNAGYIGLIALLITFAIISLLVWRTDLFGENSGQKERGEDNAPKNIIEKDMQALQSAKDAKAMLELRNKQQLEGISD
ncbi:MAG TPA: hypothetical protein VJH63_03295 [Candidatus Paceibacterota bacterium]